MDEIDSLNIMLEIAEGQECDLEHHDNEEHPAVDSIILPIGYKESEGVYVQKRELVIFVCEDCANSLSDPEDDWVLMYCLRCNSSQWIYTPLARKPKSFYKKINWMKYCHKCHKEK